MKITQKRTRFITGAAVLAMLLAVSTCAMAGDLEPPAPPGPTMKTLDEVEVRIPIPGSDTPAGMFIIYDPGSYYLTGDRYAIGSGIFVNADNVTIDLMGYSLIGFDTGMSTGIDMYARQNVEIRNGTVRDFHSRGIDESSNGKGHRILNVRVISNEGFGMFLLGEGHLVKNCTARGNAVTGIRVGSASTVSDNIAYENVGDGIYAESGSVVTGNTVFDNDYGIKVGIGSTVSGNSAYQNRYRGISAGSGSTVTGNTAYKNQGHGILSGLGSTISGNTAYQNQYSGIWLSGNNLVDQNTVYDNNQSGGIYVNMNNPGNCTFGVNHAP